MSFFLEIQHMHVTNTSQENFLFPHVSVLTYIPGYNSPLYVLT